MLSLTLTLNEQFGCDLRVRAFLFRPQVFPWAVMGGEGRSRERLQGLRLFVNISLHMKLSAPAVAILYY